MASSDESIQRAEEIAHSLTISIALAYACALRYFEGKAWETKNVARRLVALATERDLPAWGVAGTIFDGWTRVEAGEGSPGIAQIREGLLAAKTSGALLPLEPLYMAVFAEACCKLGNAEEGLSAIDEALAMMAAMGAQIWLSELHRVKGELLLVRAPSDRAAAESSFRTALAIARQQGSRAWELRAATSLCRLLKELGWSDEARQTLGDVYGQFTEGLDTANLTNARVLLAELA